MRLWSEGGLGEGTARVRLLLAPNCMHGLWLDLLLCRMCAVLHRACCHAPLTTRWVPCVLSHACVHAQARDRVVLGLAECLRLTPPRTAAHQPADLPRRLWSVAKAYWLQAASASAAQQQLLAATQAAAATAGQQQAVQQLQQLLSRSPSGPRLGALLVQLQAGGRPLTKQQLAAAQALVQAVACEQQRHAAAVAGLWGLACIGGHMFFSQEMGALCQVRRRVHAHSPTVSKGTC